MAKRSEAAEPTPADFLAIAIASIPPSPAEQRQLSQIFLWIIQGQTEADITEAIRATWPGQDPRALIAFAIEQIKASASYDPTTIRGWCFEAYRELYRMALANLDIPTAIRAVSKIQEMTGAV